MKIIQLFGNMVMWSACRKKNFQLSCNWNAYDVMLHIVDCKCGNLLLHSQLKGGHVIYNIMFTESISTLCTFQRAEALLASFFLPNDVLFNHLVMNKPLTVPAGFIQHIEMKFHYVSKTNFVISRT